MVTSYVALGDSFTAGNGIGNGRRWADLLAAELAAGREDFQYLNLARDGATSSEVEDTIEPAIELGPDLVTLVCGANDVLLSTRPDIAGFRERYDRMLGRLKAGLPGAKILVSNYPAGSQIHGLGPRTQRRLQRGLDELNRIIVQVSFSRGIACLDVTEHPGVREPGNLDADGLHPSVLGHRRAADEYSRALTRHFGMTPNPRRVPA
jgi:lysophospholipase L1-like esterase